MGDINFYNDKGLRLCYPSKKTEGTGMHCRKCGSEAFVKNGSVAGVQRYKCKECGFQFTRETPHGKPMKDKILALVLYLSGLSMTMIGKIIGVSTQSVMRWIKMFYDKFAENESQANIEEIEVDEMVSYINKKKITSGSGKLLIITLENLSAGNVVIVVPKP
ncbi:helix-turn-helix domain-containing protein [uncultured Mailhella sp.]|uniref:IS1/IS1595 family N-terminal zinc-binding domain-containing protein n=1 Tax=uncultured Mailhella sp. TaxID=1981031 RepID=UPI0026263F4C|nr:helix-turn-helix domain-containing protein [uncultured Mailhella sp.]